MILKTNLHFHTADDPHDLIGYTTKEGIDRAAEHGFKALALTCHNKFAWTPEHAAYAKEKDVLLIPGIELDISEEQGQRGRHVIILGCTPEAEHVRTFSELERYRNDHPECLVLAPHPFFYGNFSLHEYFDPYAHLFDAVEHSWFYSKRFNRNTKAAEAAARHNLPLIATSDTHFFYDDHLERNFALVNADDLTVDSVLIAIKAGRFENATAPSRFFKHMLFRQGWFFISQFIQKRILRQRSRV